MATVNRQFLPRHCMDTSLPSLLFKLCRRLTNEVAAHFFSSKYRSCLNQPVTWLHNCVTIFACCDIYVPRYHSPSVFNFRRSEGRACMGTRLRLHCIVEVYSTWCTETDTHTCWHQLETLKGQSKTKINHQINVSIFKHCQYNAQSVF